MKKNTELVLSELQEKFEINLDEVILVDFIVILYNYFKIDDICIQIEFMESRFKDLSFHANSDIKLSDILKLVKEKYDLNNISIFDINLYKNVIVKDKIYGFNIQKCNDDLNSFVLNMYIDLPDIPQALKFKSLVNEKVIEQLEEILIDTSEIILSELLQHESYEYLYEYQIISEEQMKLIKNFSFGKVVPINSMDTYITRFYNQLKYSINDTAIIFGGIKETYSELNNASNQVALFLNKCNPKKVALLIDRSNFMMECILGIWKSGASYIPMEKRHPMSRTLMTIEEADPQLIICDDRDLYNNLVEKSYVKVIYSDDLRDFINTQTNNKKNINNISSQEDLAYIIYTSGSTGKPKGAMVEHIGMLNHMEAKIDDLHLSKDSVIAQLASQCFDISVWQMFVSLLVGGSTLIISDEDMLEPERCISLLEKYGVTELEVVPSYLNVLLEYITENNISVFGKLEHLIVTGERVNVGLVNRWFNNYPSIKVVNAYGPTEASDDITHYIMKDRIVASEVPIGRPIQNMRIYTVDQHMMLTPIGVSGEIIVAGIGVGRGYLNDSKRTNDSFMDYDPILGIHQRTYRTGDFGRWGRNGVLEFIGRKDEQIKVRGYRIELGDIKNALLKYDSIKDAVVMCCDDIQKEKIIVAFIIEEYSADLNIIYEFLSNLLPVYMIPKRIIELSEFPLQLNGKIDINKLKKDFINN